MLAIPIWYLLLNAGGLVLFLIFARIDRNRDDLLSSFIILLVWIGLSIHMIWTTTKLLPVEMPSEAIHPSPSEIYNHMVNYFVLPTVLVLLIMSIEMIRYHFIVKPKDN